jgi:hypothetical protein
MGEYEIRILQNQNSSSIISVETHLSEESAIRSARRMARGREFEVWRGIECISGRATLDQASAA